MNLRPIRRGLVALACVLLPSLLYAQGIPAYQSGLVTPGHLLKGAGNGQHMDVGTLTGDTNGRGVRPFAIQDDLGLGLCTHSAVTGGSHYEFCIGHNTNGDALLSVTANGGAVDKSVYLSKNGVLYEMPFVGAGSGNVVGPASSTVDTCALWNNTSGTALKTGGCVVGPGSAATGDIPVFSDSTGKVVGGTSGALFGNQYGLTIGYGAGNSDASRLTARNIYTGANASPNTLYGLLDYRPASNIAANPSAAYGDLWFNSAHTITGLGAAGRFNAYTIPQLTASVSAAGSGYINGDQVTILGGSCTGLLNTPPQFTLTVAAGVVTAATYTPAGACETYPANPVSVTGGSGSGLTLNLSHGSINLDYLVGGYGRPRHMSRGTVTTSAALVADGLYNTGGGTVTNAVGLYLNPPYDANHTNSYGIYVPTNISSFSSGVIGSAAGVDITLNPGAGGAVSSTAAITAGIGQPCSPSMIGGSNAQLQALGADCYTYVQAQGAGQVVLATNGGLAAAKFSAPLLAVNAVDVAGAVAGAPPTIGVSGTDANINLRLNAKGTGGVVAGTATAGSFGLQYTTSAAAVPGNFAANRYLQITAGGVTVYVPAMLATW